MLATLRQRNFSLLWFAGLISMMGDWMLTVALPVAVYELTDSVWATSGIVIANRCPSVVLGSFAGVYVDRWDRRRTMIVVNTLRAPMMLVLLLVDSANDLWIAYLVTFVISTLNQFFGPAENALLPQLVGEDKLVPANALNALNNNIARLVGPALGGIVAGWYGLHGVALVDAGSFWVAAALIAAISAHRTRAPAPERDQSPVSGVRAEWLDGLRVIRQSSNLRVLFVVMALTSIAEGIMGTVFWAFITDVLHGGTVEVGWFLSAQAVGGIVGAFVIGRWATGLAPMLMLGLGSLGLGVIDSVTFNYPALLSGIWLGLILMMVVGVPATSFFTGFATMLQTDVNDAFRGRAFGAFSSMMAVMMIAGAVVAGLVSGYLGVVGTLGIQCLAFIAAGAYALIAWRSGPRDLVGTEETARGQIAGMP